MLDYARHGDTVVVAAIDRLGRFVAEVKAPTEPDVGDQDVFDTEQAGIDVARYATDRIAARTIETFAGHRLAARRRGVGD